MQFQLSGLTAGNTRILTVPNASTTIVGTDVSQTLTNKTITDVTNNVMAKSLRSATTTIDVSASTAPTNGQVLTANSSTVASWQSITSSLISDFTITDLKTNDMLLYNGTKWANNSSIYASLTLLQTGYFQLSLPVLMDNTNTLLISACVSRYS